MSNEQENSDTSQEEPEKNKLVSSRTFLCVVDESDEFPTTLRYACARAKSTDGRIALLYIVQPAEFQHWLGVGDLMKQENREEAEEMCHVLADVVQRRIGKIPVIYIREGKPHEVLLELIREEHDLSVLVLGASSTGDGPGPIIQHVVNNMAGAFSLPITIVPGGLSNEEIDAIT